jgi:Fe-S-cluster containining protein
MTTQAPPDPAIFRETGEEVMRRLKTARSPDDALAVARYGSKEMNRTFARSDSALKAMIACRSGCSFCCHVPLGVQAHEILLAADYIRKKFTPEEVEAVIERARIHRGRVAGISGEESDNLRQTCPLLRDHACSIYEARPEVCRAHHSLDAGMCERFILTDHPIPDVIEIRARMFGVMLGIDHAFVEAGYDGCAYDFGSALQEALTNPACLTQWAAKGRAFPDSCREPIRPGHDRHGEIPKMGLFQKKG